MPYFVCFGGLEQGRVLGLYWFAPAVPASFQATENRARTERPGFLINSFLEY